MIWMTGAFFCWGALLVDMAWLSCRKFVWSQNFNRLASHLPFLKVRKILYTTVRGREVQLPGRKNKSPLGWYISQGAVWQIPLHRHLVHDYV